MNQLTLKVDLYEYSQVEKACKLAAEKLGLNREGLEADLQRLTDLLEYYRDQQLYKSKEHQRARVQVPAATATKCIEFLKSDKLIAKLNELNTSDLSLF